MKRKRGGRGASLARARARARERVYGSDSRVAACEGRMLAVACGLEARIQGAQQQALAA